MHKFNEVHLFIDETGSLANPAPNSRPCLVGGVAYFGDYAAINSELEDLLEDELERAYYGDLSELHYHNPNNYSSSYNNNNYWLKKNRFLGDVAKSLRDLPFADHLIALSIRHVEDVSDALATLNENERDNRYLFMLQSLIERFLFIDAAPLLTLDAKVVLRVASRTYVLPSDAPDVPELRETMRRRRGSHFELREHNGEIRVPFFHTVDEVEGMINNLMRFRWSRFQYRVETRIEPINYDRSYDVSDAGYYLADLFLGQKQFRLRRPDDDRVPASPIVDELYSYDYDAATAELARCEAAFADGSRDRFSKLLYEKPRVAANGLFDDFKTRFAESASGDELLALWKTALSKADDAKRTELAQARAIFANVEEIAARRRETLSAPSNPTQDAKIEATRICVRLAIANHSGAVDEGDDVWNEYLTLSQDKKTFDALPPELRLEYASEIGRRRVVNLFDAFRLDEARAQAQECVDLQKKLFDFYRDVAPRRPQLGYALSQLAQIETFGGALDDALRHFDEAATHYDPVANAGDLERNNIYLGHLACETANARFGDGGVALWTRTLETTPLLDYDEQRGVWPLLEDLTPNRFLVALMLKGALFFAHDHSATNLVLQWNDSNLKKAIDASLQAGESAHPDGVILQSIAALTARFPRFFPNEKVRSAYNAAVESFQQAETPLMDFLAAVAKTRKCLWGLDAKEPNVASELAAAVAQTKKTLENPAFSPDVWQETPDEIVIFGRRLAPNASNEEKARAVVAGVRFNYC